MTELLFATQTEVLKHLHGLGLKIGKSKISSDVRSGRLPCTSDKRFRESDVLAYAQSLSAPSAGVLQKDRQPPVITDQLKKLLVALLKALPHYQEVHCVLKRWLAQEFFPDHIMEAVQAEAGAALERLNFALERIAQEEAAQKFADKGQAAKERIRKARAAWSGQDQAGEVLPKNHDMFDHPARINLRAAFCFTGIFAMGEREKCEEMARMNGGVVVDRPVKGRDCYVVVGNCANLAWSSPQAGRKIMNALHYRQEGCPIQIIHEDDWAAAVSGLRQQA